MTGVTGAAVVKQAADTAVSGDVQGVDTATETERMDAAVTGVEGVEGANGVSISEDTAAAAITAAVDAPAEMETPGAAAATQGADPATGGEEWAPQQLHRIEGLQRFRRWSV